MPSAELLRLAERVEGLTGPDREIDGLIACAIFKTISTDDDLIYRVPICKADECEVGTYWHVQRSDRSLQTAPNYTGSLDAAVSLVPTNWWLTLDRYSISDKAIDPFAWRAWLKTLTGDVDGDGPCYRIERFANCATPALALTAACLKARAPARCEASPKEPK